MSVKKDGKREVQGIATFEGFYNNIQVVDLWNKYGENTGATSLSDLINQLENSGRKESYGATTLISYMEIGNFKCDFLPWKQSLETFVDIASIKTAKELDCPWAK